MSCFFSIYILLCMNPCVFGLSPARQGSVGWTTVGRTWRQASFSEGNNSNNMRSVGAGSTGGGGGPYRPIPVMPSPLFQQLALSQLELLASSLIDESTKKTKIKTIALYLPQENPRNGQLEFSPALCYPDPNQARIFIASEAQSGVPPKLPRTLTTLPGFAHATKLIPGYPMLATSTVNDAGIGVVEEVLCDNTSGSSVGSSFALSIPLLEGSRTVGVLLVSPADSTRTKQSGAPQTLQRRQPSVWSERDRQQVAIAAKSLSLALLMDAEKTNLQQQNQFVQEALSDNLHQIKNPLQALRTFGKLLQQRIADSEQTGTTPQLLELTELLLVQSDRLVDRLKPVDGIVDTLAYNQQQQQRLTLQPVHENRSTALVKFPIPLLPAHSAKIDGALSKWTTQSEMLRPSQSTSTMGSSEGISINNKSLQFTNFTRSPADPNIFTHVGNCDPNATPYHRPSLVLPVDDRRDNTVVGKINLAMVFIDDVLEPVLSSFRALAVSRGVHLQWEPQGDDLPGVTVDSEALQEAVTNLLDNALKYGTSSIRNSQQRDTIPQQASLIRVRLRPNDTTEETGVTILIEDNGPGIPRDERQTIFQRGVRGRNVATTAVEGSGIGLDIARSLVERMGGKLRAVDPNDYEDSLRGAVMALTVYRNPKLAS